MAGMRVAAAAAACAVLAAAPAAGQDSGGGPERFDAMARGVIAALNREAVRLGDRPRVTFRPASTGPEGVRVYCDALSFGLRNALHRRVEAWREELQIATFDVAVANARAVEPPDVTISWSWDGAGSVRVEAHVLLEDGRSRQVPTTVLDAAALTGPERACLFSFRADERMATAQAAGVLREEPTRDTRRIVRPFSAGEEFLVQGALVGAGRDGAVWSVVLWQDPETGEWRNLFALGLADVVTTGGGGDVVGDQLPPDEFEVGDVFRDCDRCPEMVVVPAGRFTMGSPSSEEGRASDEGPQHGVTFDSPFAVGVYEVTRGEFARFVSATGRSTGNSCWTYKDGVWRERSGRSWRSPGFSQSDSHPAVCVSWDDAKAYASWLSRETGEEYRLLSEAEWEYVARAETGTARYWGASASGQCRHANGVDASSGLDWATDCDDGYARTSPAGSFRPNGFGLHDVLGNAWEWVEDCWHENYARAPRDGRAWLESNGGECSCRVLLGGSWNYIPEFLRAALRYWDDSGFRFSYYGFRVARTFTP